MPVVSSNPFAVTVLDPSAGFPLSTLAAGLAPKQWVQLPATWAPTTYDFWHEAGISGSILDFAHSAHWDPVRNKLYFVGSGYGPGKYVIYDAVADVWSTGYFPAPYNYDRVIIHSWDHTSYDPARGIFYLGKQSFNSTKWAIDVDAFGVTSGWSELPTNGGGFSDTYGSAFWPSRDGWFSFEGNQNGALWMLDYGATSWTSLGSIGAGFGYHTMAVHDPVRDVIYFGGGHVDGTRVYEINTSDVATPLPNCPISLNGSNANSCADPTSGHLLALHTAASGLYEYVPGTGWQSVATTPPTYLTGKGNTISASVVVAGVGIVLYAAFNSEANSGQVWLYRHT